MRRYHNGFTVEETDAILAEHYPWAVKERSLKIKVQAQHLRPGDIVGSGETVKHVSVGTRTPTGKVDVWLDARFAQWGKHTMINVERP